VGVVRHVCLRLVYCFLQAAFVLVFHRCSLVRRGDSHIFRIEVTCVNSSHQLKTSMQRKHSEDVVHPTLGYVHQAGIDSLIVQWKILQQAHSIIHSLSFYGHT
jgi:hypothetical protein